MKQPPEPTRLLDELAASGDLYKGLSRLQANAPSAASMAAMAASLGVTAAAPSALAASKSGVSILKVIAGVGVVVGAAIGGAQLLPVAKQAPAGDAIVAPAVPATALTPAVASPAARETESAGTVSRGVGSAADSPAAIEEEAARPEIPSTVPGADGAARPQPRAGGAHEVTAARPGSTPAAPRNGAASAASPATTYESLQGTTVRQTETELLRDARSALGGSPSVALALTEKHRREYPSGAYSQERELIAITALTRLSRASDAQERADRFRRAYPKSAYLRQIDQLVP